MTVTRKKINNLRERQILMAMVVSPSVLEGLGPEINPEYFTNSYSRTVARWCVEYFKKYRTSPGKHIFDLLADDVNSGKLDKTAGELVGKTLNVLRENWLEETDIDPAYMIDQGQAFFNEQRLKLLNQDIEQQLAAGNVAGAVELVKGFQISRAIPNELGRGYTLKELMETTLPDCRYLIPDLLPLGFNPLVARMKFGKTHLCYNMALAVVMGTPFLGRYPVEQGEVLFLDLEQAERQCRTKFKAVLEAQGLGDSWQGWGHRLTIQPRGSWPRMDRGGLEMLEKFAQEHPALSLVVIDTWKLFAPPRRGGDQYNYDLDYLEVGQVKDVAEKYNLCVVPTHHLNKGWKSNESPFDAIWGSTGFAAAADNLYVLTPSPGEADAVLHGVGRYIDGFQIALEKDTDKKAWYYLGDAAAFELTQEQGAIIEAIKDNEAMGPTEIAAVLGKGDAKGVNAIKQILYRMKTQGKVINKGGKYYITNNNDIKNNNITSNPSNLHNPSNSSNPHNLEQKVMGVTSEVMGMVTSNQSLEPAPIVDNVEKVTGVTMVTSNSKPDWYNSATLSAGLEKVHIHSWRTSN
jgi:hypothetical protein